MRGERILSLVQAPSLWEGWGGLLVVCRIIYPHTPSRRIAYPPELVDDKKTPQLLASVEKYTRQELTKVELFNSKEIGSLGDSYYKE